MSSDYHYPTYGTFSRRFKEIDVIGTLKQHICYVRIKDMHKTKMKKQNKNKANITDLMDYQCCT